MGANPTRGAMAYKDKNDPRYKEARLRHYHKNKEVYKGRAAALRESLKQLVSEFKNKPCMDCKQKYPTWVMDLDHRDPSTKEFEIQKLVMNNNKPKLLIELEKCDVVCANCHRMRTARRANWVDRIVVEC